MNDLLYFLSELNVQIIIWMAVMVWIFYRELKIVKASAEKLDEDMRKLESKIGRFEGIVYGKDVYSKVDD